MRHTRFSLLIALVLSATALQAQFLIPRSVIGSGGVPASNAQYQLNGTLSQTVIGPTRNQTRQVFSGFWYNEDRIPLGIESIPGPRPDGFRLTGNYPNPFLDRTTITFALPEHADISLRIYDAVGREVAVLADGVYEPGNYSAEFIPKSQTSGLYLAVLTAPGARLNHWMMRVR